MAERDEAVALGFSCGLVEDDDGLVEVAVGGEDGSEGVGGGIAGEAADEELAEGGVTVGEGADGVEDVGVAEGGGLEEVEELVLGEGLEDLADVVGGEGCDGGGRWLLWW